MTICLHSPVSPFLCESFVTQEANTEAALAHTLNSTFTCWECAAQTWFGSVNMALWDPQTLPGFTKLALRKWGCAQAPAQDGTEPQGGTQLCED